MFSLRTEKDVTTKYWIIRVRFSRDQLHFFFSIYKDIWRQFNLLNIFMFNISRSSFFFFCVFFFSSSYSPLVHNDQSRRNNSVFFFSFAVVVVFSSQLHPLQDRLIKVRQPASTVLPGCSCAAAAAALSSCKVPGGCHVWRRSCRDFLLLVVEDGGRFSQHGVLRDFNPLHAVRSHLKLDREQKLFNDCFDPLGAGTLNHGLSTKKKKR